MKTLLLIAGMHRSGTSAFARTLNLLGAAIPGSVMPAAADNPSGFWESSEIEAIHGAFLRDIGSTWDDIRPLPDSLLQGQAAHQCLGELLDLMRRCWAAHPVAVVKDPRLCRLLPLWRHLAHISEADCRIVIPLRHPLAVAKSLAKRNNWRIERGLLSWLVHLLEVERHSRGLPRLFIPYDQMLANTDDGLDHLAQTLELTVTPAVRRQIADFWRQELRHHDGETERALPPLVSQAWEWFSTGQTDIRVLDEIAQAWRATALGFQDWAEQHRPPADEDSRILMAANRTLTEAVTNSEQRVGQLAASLEVAQNAAQQLAAQLAQNLAEKARLEDQLTQKQAQSDHLAGLCKTLQQDLQQTGEKLKAIQAQQAKDQALIQQLTHLIDSQARTLDDKAEELSATQHSMTRILMALARQSESDVRKWPQNAVRRLYKHLTPTPIAFGPHDYAKIEPDAAGSGLDPLLHYLLYGIRKRRLPSGM